MKLINQIFILFSFGLMPVFAQITQDTLSSFKMDSVIVSAARSSILLNESPFSIDIIDNQSIAQNSNPISLQNIIGNHAGILLNNRFNPSQGDRILIRGIGTRAQFGVKGIKIMLDGIPLTFPDGQSQLNNIDIQNIESVEILKGPSSVLYGNSLGGIILIKSKQAGSEKFSARPEILIGSYGLQKFGLFTAANFDKINLSLSGYHLHYDGYREHSESEYYGLNLASEFNVSKNIQISVNGNYFNAPYLLNPGSLNKYDSDNTPEKSRSSMINFGTGKNAEQLQGGINLNFAFNNNSKVNTTFYSVSRTLFNSIPGRVIELDRVVAGMRLEFDNKIQIGEYLISTLTGLDLDVQYDKRSEFENEGIINPDLLNPSDVFDNIVYSKKLLNQDEDVKNIGMFVNINFKPLNKLNISAALRYDNYNFEVNDKLYSSSNKISMSNLSSMIGFSSNLFMGFTIYGNYSNGFQTPTTNELSNNHYGESGFNEELNPEKINNYEIGINYWLDELHLLISSSGYRMNISNMLIPYQSETEETFYRNAGKADNTGIEAQLKFHPAVYTIVTANYTYMNFKFGDYLVESELNNNIETYQLKGKYLPGIPKNKLSLSIDFKVSENIHSYILLSWTDKYFTNDYNGPAPTEDADIQNFINDSHTKINLNAGYRFNAGQISFNLKLGIENLLDEKYNDSIVPNAFGNNFFEPAAGRSYFISITSDF